MAERIGVFICECGPNIKEAIDIDDALRFTKEIENVVVAEKFGLLCSAAGKSFLKDKFKEHNLTRVVIAACSPKEHEITFMNLLRESGINPFFLQIANIREQCAWVIKDSAAATGKAKEIILAAVKRVAFHEPLEVKEIECNPDVLVVGAGIAGISAALTLAQKNRKVYLIEKLPVIGGKVARYEEVFPSLKCASCMLDPVLDKVLHDANIELITLAEVQEVSGFFGNFIVKIKRRARFVDLNTCIGCEACFELCPVKVKNEYELGQSFRKAIFIPYAGNLPNAAVIDKEHCLRFQGKVCNACQNACPFGSINYNETDKIQELNVGAIVLSTGFEAFNPDKAPQYGYGKIKNVYTSLEFERLLSSTGPTKGKVLLKDGRIPKTAALIHCVGSRDQRYNEYCSGTCCMTLLKFAQLIKKKNPEVSVTEFYSDFCLPGKEGQKFLNALAEKKGINFVRLNNFDSIKLSVKKDKIIIKYENIFRKSKTDCFDLVVLGTALEATSEAKEIAEIFGLARDKNGFFLEEDGQLAPVSTAVEGIFVAGCAKGPKDIQGSVIEAQAAAGKILSRLIPGEKLKLEPKIAVIDGNLCSGCKICLGLCPYNAIIYDNKEKRAKINEVLCRGCGVCVVACPSAAIQCRHFTEAQIAEEIKSYL